MILSVSRRTDIPAFFTPWFFRRLEEGYVLVRNPRNPHQVSRVELNPDAVDGMVFWTKNPLPLLDKLDRLADYTYYVQFTLTPYGPDVEPGVPSKSKVGIPTFQRLSEALGSDRVIWRYDPIFLSCRYTVEYHIRYFEELARRLSPYTKKCVISFLDLYRKIQRNMAPLELQELTPSLQDTLAGTLAGIAHSYGLEMETCAEDIDLEKYGIHHGRCVDDRLFSRLLGRPLLVGKDRNQRRECGCVESIDIGAYSTCRNGCRYCYANFSATSVAANLEHHDPSSPLLLGHVGPEDKVTSRRMESLLTDQLTF
ncbi:MAG: DUF1848 domain-containing protein [Acutalibacter sp.]|jgi:hypothetical protein